MGCIEHIPYVILDEFSVFYIIFEFIGCDDLHQTRARNARLIGEHEHDEHVFIDDVIAWMMIDVVIILFQNGFVHNVAGNDRNGTMGEDAGLNQGLIGTHAGRWQPMPFVIVHAARIKLCNGVIATAFVSGSAPQMHNAAINIVFQN